MPGFPLESDIFKGKRERFGLPARSMAEIGAGKEDNRPVPGDGNRPVAF